ncbi:barstar family protein [Veillonella rodentium]|nr:barstar family protein [Veillonella rodentium]
MKFGENRMVHNKFIILSEVGCKSEVGILEKRHLFKAIIDGSKINSKEDLFQSLAQAFFFPSKVVLWSQFEDYLRDLSWLNTYDGYILIVKHFNDMFLDNPSLKVDFIDSFSNYILPFWEEEVINVVVNGISKLFYVYATE